MLAHARSALIVRRLGVTSTARLYFHMPLPEGVLNSDTRARVSSARVNSASPAQRMVPVQDGASMDPSVVERVLETSDSASWLSEPRFSSSTTSQAQPLHSPPPNRSGGAPLMCEREQQYVPEDWGSSESTGADSSWTLHRAEGVLSRYRKWFRSGVDYHTSASSLSASLTDAQLDEVRSFLDYSMRCDAAQRSSLLREAAQLAYLTGFHRRCLDLFLIDHDGSTNFEHVPLREVGMHNRNVAGLHCGSSEGPLVPSHIFAAALQCDDTALLMRLARIVLASYTGHGTANPPPTPPENNAVRTAECTTKSTAQAREGLYEVQVLRLYAHCVCVLGRASQRRHLRDIASIESSGSRTSSSASPAGLGFLSVVEEIAQECARRLLSDVEAAPAADLFLQSSLRRVAYCGGHDAASRAALFQQVFQEWARQFENATRSPANCEWLTASLLSLVFRASSAVRRWDHVEYYSLYADVFLRDRCAQGHTTLTRQEDELVLAYVRYALFTRQWSRGKRCVLDVTRQFPDYLPSIETATLAARVAMASPDSELATWALETVLAGNQLAPPSSSDLLTCLSAVARCGLHTFPEVLRSCIDSGLVQLNEEELLYVQLLHCRRSVRWREEVDALMSAFHLTGDDGGRDGSASLSRLSASLSSRNVYQLLLILQEGEHPHFMAHYRLFLSLFAPRMGLEERGRWAIFALTWVTLRCGNVDVNDVLYTAEEVLQLWRADHDGVSSHTGDRISTDTRRSLLTKWGVLKSQYSDVWWRQQLKVVCTEAQQGSASSVPTDESHSLNVVSLFLSSASKSASSVAVPVAARFLKRPSLVKLREVTPF